MKIIMKYFTCEGRFSRIYQYHIILLMHFTSEKPLNFPNYLFRSLVKMTEKVQSKIRYHHASLLHHALVKVIVLHQLIQINMSWEYILEGTTLLPISNQSKSQSSPSSPSGPQGVQHQVFHQWQELSLEQIFQGQIIKLRSWSLFLKQKRRYQGLGIKLYLKEK